MDLEEIHLHVYCAAITTLELNNQRSNNSNPTNQTIRQPPKWEQRIKRKIDTFRPDIGRTQQLANGNKHNRVFRRLLADLSNQLRDKTTNEK